MRCKKPVISLMLPILLMACNDKRDATNSTQSYDSAAITTVSSKMPTQPQTADGTLSSGGETPEWLKDVVMRYLKGTDNKLIKSMGVANESWIIDDVQATDNGKYISIQIGHHVSEADGSEPRFVTDQWIGVDSQTRTIYEYDVVNDTTMVWGKNKP